MAKKKLTKKVIDDNRGQWAHPGEVTRINSRNITMKGVPYPVLGVGADGEERMMYPEEEHTFNQGPVTEYPMMEAKDGGWLSKFKNASNAQGWKPNDEDLRADGTRKGTGYFGVLDRPNGGVSSEISMGVEFDGKEVEIPTMVPTLNREELNYLLTTPVDRKDLFTTPIGQSIGNKAVEFARERMNKGLNPFYQEGEERASLPRHLQNPGIASVYTENNQPDWTNVNEYKRGGTTYLNEYQPGGKVKPIIVPPGDPRLQSYQDSLNLYKGYLFQRENQLENKDRTKIVKKGTVRPLRSKDEFKPHPYSYEETKRQHELFEMFLKQHPDDWFDDKFKQERLKRFPVIENSKEDLSSMNDFKKYVNLLFNNPESQSGYKIAQYYKTLGFPDSQIAFHTSPDLYHPNISPVADYFDGVAWSPIYKKPVRKVLTEGSEGANNVIKQQQLVDAGYDITVDGAWGDKSQQAWDDYQKKLNTSNTLGDTSASGTATSNKVQRQNIYLGGPPPSESATTEETAPIKPKQQTGRMGELENHQAGFYDAAGKEWQFVNGKLVPAPRFKDGGKISKEELEYLQSVAVEDIESNPRNTEIERQKAELTKKTQMSERSLDLEKEISKQSLLSKLRELSGKNEEPVDYYRGSSTPKEIIKNNYIYANPGDRVVTTTTEGVIPRIKPVNAVDDGIFLAFADAVTEYKQLYPNRPVPRISSGIRTRAQQEQQYANRANNPYPVAKPGTSKHELGQALDIVFDGGNDGDYQRLAALMAPRGFKWLGDYDKVHFEVDPNYPKTDISENGNVIITNQMPSMQLDVNRPKARSFKDGGWLNNFK